MATMKELETVLEKKYKGKYCTFQYPGYNLVHGIVDSIVVDTLKLPLQEILIRINDTLYSVSFDCLKECLQIVKHGT